MAFCTNCGKKIDEEARFCSECGTPVASTQPVLNDENAVEVEETSAVQQETPAEEVAPIQQETPVEEVDPIQQETPVEEVDPIQQEIPEEEAPVSTEETKAEKKAKKKAEKKAKGKGHRGVFRTILAVLLCIVIFAVSCAATLLTSMRSVISKENVENTIYTVLENLDNIPAPEGLEGLEDDATLMDAVVFVCEQEGVKLRGKNVNAFIEKSELLATVSETVATYISDVLRGTSEAALDVRDVEKALEKDYDLLYEISNGVATRRDMQLFLEELEYSDILDFTDAKVLKREMSPVYYGVQHGLSIWMIIAVWTIVTLLVILLALINRWCVVRTAKDAGITLTVSSAVVLLAVWLLPMVLGGILKAMPAGKMISALSSYLVRGMILDCVIVLAVGVVLILVGFIISAIAKAIQKRREAKAIAA